LPLLNELFALYKGNSVINFISISNIDSQEALRFVQKKLGIKYELVAKNQEMAEKFKVSLYPTNLIINRAGNIVFYEQGFHADIKDRMNSVINEVIK
jgi:thioredoxin-related protein